MEEIRVSGENHPTLRKQTLAFSHVAQRDSNHRGERLSALKSEL